MLFLLSWGLVILVVVLLWLWSEFLDKKKEGFGPKTETVPEEESIRSPTEIEIPMLEDAVAPMEEATEEEETEAAEEEVELEDLVESPESVSFAGPVEEGESAAEEKQVPSEPEPQAPDNLRRIEGIGPKISGVLQEAGITTFATLANTGADELRQILDDAGIGRISDPATWPEQAKLAAQGDWEGLEALQEELKGGRRV
jgi:predicted flap endonuclease-1-like 5' DNA nuclease